MAKTEKQPKEKKKKNWKVILIVIAVLAVLGLVFGGGGGNSDNEEAPAPEENQTAITLTFGETGEYGTEMTIGDKSFIAYHVPAGTYTATNKGENMAQVTVYKDGTEVNEDGVEEQIMGDQKPLMLDTGASDTLVVGEGEYIEIYENEVIELVAN